MMINKLTSLARSFKRDADGVVAIEFAIVAPVMVLILVGIVQVGGHIIERSATERAATELLHIASQLDNTTPSTNAQTAFERAFENMASEDRKATYKVFIRHFERVSGTASEQWEVEFGTLSETSNLGGGTLTNTTMANLIPNDGDALVTVEVFREQLRFDLSTLVGSGTGTHVETTRMSLTR